jgi:hypothetical protein
VQGLKPSLFSRLTLPVAVFKKQMHPAASDTPISVTWDTTFAAVVELVLHKHIHRVCVRGGIEHGLAAERL